MRNFGTLLSTFLLFPLTAFAHQPQADTIGMKITRTLKTIETTAFVKQSIDSIVSLDSLGKANKITLVTYDTLRGTEATDITDTSYFVIKPLKHWKLQSQSDATLTQINRWNWAQGGINVFSILLSSNFVANYALGLSTWRTELDWRYAGDLQENDKWFKTQDRFNIVSQYGFKASPTWNYSGLFEFNTQLFDGFKRGETTLISSFLSPARSTFSLGMTYSNNVSSLTAPNAKNPNLIDLFLSPVAYRATYVRDTTLSTRFDVAPNEHWLSTFGVMLRLDNRHLLTKNLSLRNRLNLFANILEMKDQFVTVDWRINFDIRLTRHFTLGLETWLIYDPTVWFDKTLADETIERERKTQFQQSLMLRFSYKIANY